MTTPSYNPPLPASRPFAPHERLVVNLELTNACNYRCPFCPQAYHGEPQAPGMARYDRRNGFMSRAVFERSVDECTRVARCVELGFFGEQTLHPDYVEYIRTLGERKAYRLETNTNVSLLTHEMMRALIDARFDLVRLSIDAITPELYNRVRPGPCKDLAGRIVHGDDRIAAIHEKIEHWLAMSDHRPTRIVYVKSSHNDVPGERERFLARWTPRLGAHDQVLMKRVLSYGGKIADPHVRASKCNVWDVRYLVIGHTGTLSPCNLDTNLDLALGNIMDDSVEAIYFGDRANELRGRTGCGNPLTPCSTCTDANNWSANETFTKPVELRITA